MTQPARHGNTIPRDDPGIPSSEFAMRAEADQSNRLYMERITLYVTPLAQRARCTKDWALRCLANGRWPL